MKQANEYIKSNKLIAIRNLVKWKCKHKCKALFLVFLFPFVLFFFVFFTFSNFVFALDMYLSLNCSSVSFCYAGVLFLSFFELSNKVVDHVFYMEYCGFTTKYSIFRNKSNKQSHRWKCWVDRDLLRNEPKKPLRLW